MRLPESCLPLVHRLPRLGRQHERGTSLVEFALILPLLMVLITGIIDFGRAYQTIVTLTNAAREGARVGATGATAGAIQTRVVSTAGVPITSSNVQVEGAAGASGSSVRVTVNYTFAMITPFGPLLGLLGANTVGNTFNLSSTADMRLE